MRILLCVIDGFGIGALQDASIYGDENANTYQAVKSANIPNLRALGLDHIYGVGGETSDKPLGAYGRVRELSSGKDTLIGHREICGIIQYMPSNVYPSGFPHEIIEKLRVAFGRDIIGNVPMSGTEIIKLLGAKHVRNGNVIVYTSRDSVLQIAAHENVVPIDELYSMCIKAQEIMVGEYAVDRIIARPFLGDDGNYYRTANRKDFCAPIKDDFLLKRLKDNGIQTVGIGKIDDIFAGVGLTKSVIVHGNNEVYRAIMNEIKAANDNALIFANFGDTDTLYGHRRDVDGYINCLEKVDGYIGDIMEQMFDDDILIVTSDHGNDPSCMSSTDHTREYVPIIYYGKNLKAGTDLHTLHGMDITAHTILDLFGIMTTSRSLQKEIMTTEMHNRLLKRITSAIRKKNK